MIGKVIVGLAAAWIGGATAQAEDDAAVFESLYGRKIQKVSETTITSDDLALAGELLENARASTDHPALLKRLCEAIDALASREPAGYATAISALQLLSRSIPAQKKPALDRIAALQQRQYNIAGREDQPRVGEQLLSTLLDQTELQRSLDQDADSLATLKRAANLAAELNSGRLPQIKQSLAVSLRRQQLAARIQSLKDALQAGPSDRESARQLTMIFLVDLDSPRQAGDWADRSGDKELAARVKAAVEAGPQTAPDTLLDLGDWYRELADKADAAAKPAMNQHARDYYTRYLAVHADNDLLRKKAELALRELDAPQPTAEKPRPASAPGPAAVARSLTFIDLIKEFDAKRDVIVGKWQMESGVLHLDRRAGRNVQNGIHFGVLPTASYRLEGEFIRTDGGNQIRFVLPVGDQCTTLAINNNKFNGISLRGERLSVIKGSNMVPKKPNQFVASVVIDGLKAKIDVDLNGRPFVRWAGLIADLAPVNMPEDSHNKLAVYCRDVEVHLTKLTLKAVTGELKIAARPDSSKSSGAGSKATLPPPAGNRLAEALRAPQSARQTFPGSEIAAGPEWMDLLSQSPIPESHSEDWKLDAKGLKMKLGSRVETVWAPVEIAQKSYELVVRFKYNGKPNAWIGVVMPVGSSHKLTLNLEPRAGCGLGVIDSAKAYDNETYNPRLTMPPDRWHDLYIRMDSTDEQATIAVALNNLGIIQWTGELKRLTVIEKIERIAYGGSNCDLEFAMVKYRPLIAREK